MNNLEQFSLEDLTAVGKIVRPHGVSGMLRAISYSGSSETFSHIGRVYVQTASGGPAEHEILDFKAHKNVFLLRLKGVNSFEAAEEYRNADLLVRKDALQRQPGEYFWFEIIGLEVVLEDGSSLGVISEIIPTGSNDIYVAKDKGGKKTLIPAIHDVVQEIDLGLGRMVVNPLEGMLELDEV